ncbi:MAG: thioesterase family protein, partial [Pseudomonadota bacterium]
VVARVEIDYRRPALFDDLIEVATTLTRRGHASVEVMQAVTRDGDPLAQGVVRLGVMGRDGRPARLPDAVAVALDRLQRA